MTQYATAFLVLCRRGWRRAGWRCAAAGLPLALVATSAALVLAGAGALPGLPSEAIGRIMRLEAYVFFTGFLFAFWMIFFGPVLEARFRPAAGLVFAVTSLAVILALLSYLMSTTTRDPTLFLQYYGAVLLSYLGVFLDPRRERAIAGWWARTLWMIVLFFVVLPVARTPKSIDSWSTESSVMLAALLYFSALAAAEWSGFYFGLGEDTKDEATRKG